LSFFSFSLVRHFFFSPLFSPPVPSPSFAPAQALLYKLFGVRFPFSPLFFFLLRCFSSDSFFPEIGISPRKNAFFRRFPSYSCLSTPSKKLSVPPPLAFSARPFSRLFFALDFIDPPGCRSVALLSSLFSGRYLLETFSSFIMAPSFFSPLTRNPLFFIPSPRPIPYPLLFPEPCDHGHSLSLLSPQASLTSFEILMEPVLPFFLVLWSRDRAAFSLP